MRLEEIRKLEASDKQFTLWFEAVADVVYMHRVKNEGRVPPNIWLSWMRMLMQYLCVEVLLSSPDDEGTTVLFKYAQARKTVIENNSRLVGNMVE